MGVEGLSRTICERTNMAYSATAVTRDSAKLAAIQSGCLLHRTRKMNLIPKTAIISLLLASTHLAVAAEINLDCTEERGTDIKIFIDSEAGKGSVNVNDRVLHSCEVGKSATHYSFACPSLPEMGPLDRNELTFPIQNWGKSFKCEIAEAVETKI